MWKYELVDAETNRICYKEQYFIKGKAPNSKPFMYKGVLVQWFPMLP